MCVAGERGGGLAGSGRVFKSTHEKSKREKGEMQHYIFESILQFFQCIYVYTSCLWEAAPQSMDARQRTRTARTRAQVSRNVAVAVIEEGLREGLTTKISKAEIEEVLCMHVCLLAYLSHLSLFHPLLMEGGRFAWLSHGV